MYTMPAHFWFSVGLKVAVRLLMVVLRKCWRQVHRHSVCISTSFYLGDYWLRGWCSVVCCVEEAGREQEQQLPLMEPRSLGSVQASLDINHWDVWLSCNMTNRSAVHYCMEKPGTWMVGLVYVWYIKSMQCFWSKWGILKGLSAPVLLTDFCYWSCLSHT